MTKGKISRAEYLDRSLSRMQPWIAEGISRRTWERRRLRDRDASPSDDAGEAQLAEARASVEKIYAQMAEERERRAQWWRNPVDDWPDRIVMRNIVRDETVTIRLDGDPKRQRKQPAHAPRPWWDDPT
jgi:hypothetical protein